MMYTPPAHAEHTTIGRAIFAGGCFWCIESALQRVDGVLGVTSGYTGGSKEDATYARVSSKRTQHVEAVEVLYDPSKVRYETLLDIYWENVDPTDDGGQFYDRGPQYVTRIYYLDDDQKKLAEQSLQKAQQRLAPKVIVTKIVAAQPFYEAEPEHQDYYLQNPRHYEAYVKGSQRKEKLRDLWRQQSDHMQP